VIFSIARCSAKPRTPPRKGFLAGSAQPWRNRPLMRPSSSRSSLSLRWPISWPIRSNEIFSSIWPSSTRLIDCQSVVALAGLVSLLAAMSLLTRSRSAVANDERNSSRLSRMWICAKASWPRSR